jgi:hypothetical protein
MKTKLEKLSFYSEITYKWAVFPIFIGFYYHSFNTNLTHIFSKKANEELFNIILVVISFVTISLIFFT